MARRQEAPVTLSLLECSLAIYCVSDARETVSYIHLRVHEVSSNCGMYVWHVDSRISGYSAVALG